MPYTKKQQHYINVFMQQVDIVIALLNTPQSTSLETALATANQLINTASTGIDTATTVLSLAGIALAIPSAGISLGAAGAAITVIQAANSGYKLVKRVINGDEINPLSSDYSDREDKELSLKVLCREVASIIAATRYRHMIEEITTDKGVAEFARYGASRTLKKIYNDNHLLDNLPASEAILAYLYESIDLAKTKSNPTITVKEKYRSGSLVDWSYYAKWAYSRSRIVSTSITPGKVEYIFHASDEGWSKGFNTTLAKYGYILLSVDKLSTYQELRNAKPIPRPSYFSDLEPHLYAIYLVSRDEVQAYLSEVNESANADVKTRLSLNDYLKRELGISVIAECHDNITLKGLPLTGGNFSGVNFRRADLRGCTLHDTCWTDVHLDGAILGGVPTLLENAIFKNITAELSYWDNINFSGSDFTYARMNGARLNTCLLQNLTDKNSLWELASFTNMKQPKGLFIDRLNAEEQARLQLELRILGLEKKIEKIDQRQDRQEQKLEQVDVHLQTLLPKWPRTTYPVPAHIPEPLHAIYGAWKIAFENPVLQQTLYYYIELDALPYRNAPDTQRVKLLEGIERFYTNQDHLLLLHGDVGSGKSSVARLCQQRLWENWHNESDWIPLVIELKQVPSKVKNFLKERLHAAPYGFNDEQIDYLQLNYKFFIILDGLDECPEASLRRIKDDCELDKWHAKVLLTARTEWLQAQPDYRRTLLQDNALEIFIGFLTEVQINEYLLRRFTDTDMLWSDYQHLWEQETELHELAKSPVLLHIIYEVLPQIMAKLTDGKRHNRAWLYGIFLKAWFQREIDKPHPLDTIREDNEVLMQCFFDYMQNLAFRMFCEKTLIIEQTCRPNRISYFRDTSIPDPWAEFFDSNNEMIQQAQRSCPLSLERFEQEGKKYHRYQFIHKSLMEYATASFLWQVLQDLEDNLGNPLPVWNQRFITEERGILAFLVDFLLENQTRENDEERLLSMVYSSRGKPDNAKAASTAITLLNYVKYNFYERIIDRDLSNIHIPYADLSKNLYADINFSGSDLSYVNFIDAILVRANLSQTNLKQVKFLAGNSFLLSQKPVTTLACHLSDPDLVAYGEGSDIVIVRLSDSVKIKRLKGHMREVQSVAWSIENKLASGSHDNTVRVWDMALPEYQACICQLTGHTGSVYSVAWSIEGQLTSGSLDGNVRIWNVTLPEDQACLKVLRNGKQYTCGMVPSVAWSVKGQLASGNLDGTVCIWDVVLPDDQACMRVLKGHMNSVQSVAWSVEGKLASGSFDKTIRVWDVALPESEACMHVLKGHTNFVSSVAWSVEGKLVSGGADNTVRIWDVTLPPDQACEHTHTGHTDGVLSVAWSVEGKLASGGYDCTIRVWDMALLDKQPCVRNLIGHTKNIQSVAWSVKGELVSGGADNTVRIWDVKLPSDQACVRMLEGHTKSIESAPTISAENAENSDKNNEISSLLSIISSVAWSVKGQVAAGSFNYTVYVWDVTLPENESYVHELKGHTNFVSKVAWSVENKLASGSLDNTIRIWDIALPDDQACVRVLEGHTSHVESVAWSIKGKLASSSRDNTVRIWDITLPDGQACLHVLMGYTENAYSVAWSVKEKLALGSMDKTVRIWDVASLEKQVDSMQSRVSNQGQGYVQYNAVDGYVAFGMTREKALQLLLDNIQHISGIIESSVRYALLTEEFRQYLKQFPHNVSNEGITNYLNYYSTWKNECVQKAYFYYDVRDRKIQAGYSHPAIFQALAYIQNIELHMWRLGENQVLMPHNPEGKNYGHIPTQAESRVDLLYINCNDFSTHINGNYFSKLEIYDYENGISNEGIYPLNSIWRHQVSMRELEGHTNEVLNVVWSTQDRWLISASLSEILFWNPETWGATVQRISFGTYSLNLWNNYLAVAYRNSLYLLDIQAFPEQLTWLKLFGQCCLLLGDCNVYQAKDVSIPTQSLLTTQKALHVDTVQLNSSYFSKNANTMFNLTQTYELLKLGREAYKKKEYTLACQYISQLLSVYHNVYGENVNHFKIADSLYNLGKIYRALNDYSQALHYYTQALTMMRALDDERPTFRLAETLYELAKLYKQYDKIELAKIHCQQALNIYKALSEAIFEYEITQLEDELSNFTHITTNSQAFYPSQPKEKISKDKLNTLNEKKCIIM